jgi:uncharacterized delta-60 repeat protein
MTRSANIEGADGRGACKDRPWAQALFSDHGRARARTRFRPGLEAMEGRLLLSGGTLHAGDLDPTFGTVGKVVTDFRGTENLDDGIQAIAVLPDGKILAAGYSTDGASLSLDFALARYNPNGTLDTSFGTGGKVTTDFGGSENLDDFGNALAILPDGKILVAGAAQDGVSLKQDFALARYQGSTPSPTPPATIQLATDAVSIGETGRTVKIDLVRTGDLTKPVTVNYGTGGGTATPGKDYAKSAGTLTFNAGESRKTITVSIIDDADYEGDENFLVTLSLPSSGAVLGAKTSARVTITDNELPPKLTAVTAVRNATGGVTGLVLTFSGPLDAASASKVTPFTLRRAGADKKFGTADDIILKLSTAAYDPVRKTITLKLAAPLAVKDTLQLVITASRLLSAPGLAFDGNNDGRPGGDAAVSVKV